ncbi:hypothetical protein HYALB_00008638 [Hymenoscyphus albidus]|uniref:Palmitoyltransferase n=1 Tax=Hymenoscyphus albidus TaxID=595503 RepID=A0A9N9LFC8_9HELO|nr:hypothetical protein HYALB_00008638 [Hymenoscyphus albidus]
MKDRRAREQIINIWTARIIPLILFGVVVYTTYVTIGLLCVDYLLRDHGVKGSAIAIIVVYSILLILMTVSWLRLFLITTFNPPYVPLGPAAIREREHLNDKGNSQSEEDGLGAGEYQMTEKGGKDDPNSPGLELFYTKDVFVSEGDGRPIWCVQCKNWKPDRTHHDRASGRCIKKMDHFCPWVGGPIGENNFKFFIQYTFWTALYCLHILIVMSFYVSRQRASKTEKLNKQFVAIIALAGFFMLFTGSLTVNSCDLALKNLTAVEKLSAHYKVHVFAIKKPSHCRTRSSYYREVTYPLDDYQMSLMVRKPVPDGLSQNGNSSVLLGSTTEQGDHASNQLQSASTTPPVVVVSMPNTLPDSSHTATSAVQPHNSSCPVQAQTSRDRMATRTFAILTTAEGENPWDLGSYVANFKTVMGSSVIDWFLPTTSPCSIHEDPESQFTLGNAVKHIRERNGLMEHTYSYAGNFVPPQQTSNTDNTQQQVQLGTINGNAR